MDVKHPALIQLRGNVKKLEKFIEKLEGVEIVENKYGVDIYFEDVNDARQAISKIKKLAKVKIKSSTKYAGLRRGRVRWFFTYSVRLENED
ncbi:hypothetical protein ICJ57_09165 [Geoglobus acetivorans]|nr:hypothetical protein [Geoglobus acetivorans]